MVYASGNCYSTSIAQEVSIDRAIYLLLYASPGGKVPLVPALDRLDGIMPTVQDRPLHMLL